MIFLCLEKKYKLPVTCITNGQVILVSCGYF